jgi:long-chain acyl-CoA synthetase
MPHLPNWQRPDYPGLMSINQLLLWTRDRGSAPVLYAKRAGVWQPLTARQFYDAVRAVSAALAGRGLAKGDRVGLLSENRPEWMIADFACLSAGVADVPVYPTLPATQVAFILRDSGARGIFVSTAEQLQKVLAEWPNLPDLEWACCFDDPSDTSTARGRGAGGGQILAWRDLLATSAVEPEGDFNARLDATPGEQLATLVYTSGTTGVPKGVVLTHRNLASNVNYSTIGFPSEVGERRLSFLPLSHITERHLGYCDLLSDSTTWYAESIEKVPENLLEVKPSYIVSVPRLYEKIAGKVRAGAEARGALARRLFRWTQSVGCRMAPYWLESTFSESGQRVWQRRPPLWLRLQAAVADRLVYSKLRAGMGGRIHKAIAGGAPLGRELAEFMLSLGLIVDQGYGLTETSPVIAVNKPGARRLGSIGRPLPNIEVRLDADGELLVRGESVFSGYFKRPEETRAAFAEDGWFRTGDIARQDDAGFLYITDRKKDLIKTSGGKFIAPQPIELKLKNSPWIAEAVVVGEARKFASVLIVPNFPALEEFARGRGLQWNSRERLCALAPVNELYAAELERVNRDLARFETLKKFRLLTSEFTIDGGEITPTVKVRRRSVEQKYRDLIGSMYSDDDGRLSERSREDEAASQNS